MRLEAVVLVRRTIADVRAHQDQRGSRRFSARALQCRVDCGEIVAVGDERGMPAIGLEAFAAIFREGDIGAGSERDVIVVVQTNQLAELEVSGQ